MSEYDELVDRAVEAGLPLLVPPSGQAGKFYRTHEHGRAIVLLALVEAGVTVGKSYSAKQTAPYLATFGCCEYAPDPVVAALRAWLASKEKK